jgi:hypothetical protein
MVQQVLPSAKAVDAATGMSYLQQNRTRGGRGGRSYAAILRNQLRFVEWPSCEATVLASFFSDRCGGGSSNLNGSHGPN